MAAKPEGARWHPSRISMEVKYKNAHVRELGVR